MTDKARPASEITQELRDWSDNGPQDSSDALLKLVYAELHRQAHRYLQKERAGHLSQIGGTKIGRLGKPFSLFRHCRDNDAPHFD